MRFFTWLLLCAFSVGATAQQLSVGSPQNINIDNDHGLMRTVKSGAAWNRHAYIYPKSLLQDLPAGALVQGLSFNRAVSALGIAPGQLSGQTQLRLYVANIPADSLRFSEGPLAWSQAIQNAQLVYAADPQSIVGQTHGYKRFNFATPFVYSGGSLVLLAEYTQTSATVGEVLWTYNNNNKTAGGLAEYVEGSTKYSAGAGSTPADSLRVANVRHPNILVHYTTVPCAGSPQSGTLVSLPTVCYGQRAQLKIEGASTGTGISHEWQQYVAGRWQALTEGNGRQTTRLTTPILTQTTAFRLVTTCQTSGLSVATDSLSVGVNSVFSLPFSEGFNSLSGTANCWQTQILADVGTKASPFVRLDSFGTAPPTAPFEGDRLARFNAFGCDAGDRVRYVAPPLTSLGAASVDVSFRFFEDNEDGIANLDKMTLQFSTDGQNWTSVAAQQRYNSAFAKYGNGIGQWYERQYTLPVVAAQQPLLYVALMFESDYGSDIYVDDFQVFASKPIVAQGQCDSVVVTGVSGHNWYRVKTTDGQTLADFNPNGQHLGRVVWHYYVHSGAIRQTTAGQALLHRNFSVTPQYQPLSGPISLRLYYTDAELMQLKRVAPSIAPETMRALRAEQPCRDTYLPQMPTVLVQTGHGNYGRDHFISVSTDSLGTFFIGAGEAELPLDLISFSGKTVEKSHILTWETASETQTSHFDVERSTAANARWEAVAQVKAAGNASTRRSYRADIAALPDISYYRLKMVDLDGKTTYSRTIALGAYSPDKQVQLAPNPVSEALYMTLDTDIMAEAHITITDMAGKVHHNMRYPLSIGRTAHRIDLSDWPRGLYILKAEWAGYQHIEKITKP